MAEKESSGISIDRTLVAFCIVLLFIWFILLPAFGGTAALGKLISENIWMIIALAVIAYVLWTRRGVEVWDGPGGLELLKRAVQVCPEFEAAGIDWLDIPKGKNEFRFEHDQKNQVYHYYMLLHHDDSINTGFDIAYNPKKPKDWEPKVKYMDGINAVNLAERAKKGGKIVFTEKSIIGETASQEDEEVAETETGG